MSERGKKLQKVQSFDVASICMNALRVMNKDSDMNGMLFDVLPVRCTISVWQMSCIISQQYNRSGY